MAKPAALLIQLLCVVAVAPMLYLCRYVHPSGIDDYLNSDWKSFGTYFRHLYSTSGGRFFSFALIMLNPLHWHSMVGYRLACGAIFIAFILSLYLLIRTALCVYTSAPRFAAGAVAALSVVLMLTNMDGLAENFFWYTGAVVHTVAAILMAWLLHSLMSLPERVSVARRIYLCMLCVAIMGSSELLMFLCLAVCLTGWLYSRANGLTLQKDIYRLLLLVCVLSGIVYIIAPGNYMRLDNQHRSLTMVLPNWVYFTQKFIYTWLFDPILLMYSVALIIVTQQHPLRRAYLSLWTAFLLPIGLVYLMSFPVNLFLGTVYYPRVMNGIYVFFVLSWTVFLLHLSLALKVLLSNVPSSTLFEQRAMLIAGFITVLISLNTHDLRRNNLFLAYKGLARRIPQQYDEELKARYRLLNQGGDTITLAPLKTKYGNAVYFLDIFPEPQHEQNVAYAHYWGKKSVGRAKDTTAIRQ